MRALGHDEALALLRPLEAELARHRRNDGFVPEEIGENLLALGRAEAQRTSPARMRSCRASIPSSAPTRPGWRGCWRCRDEPRSRHRAAYHRPHPEPTTRSPMADATLSPSSYPVSDFPAGPGENTGSALSQHRQWVAPTLNPEELESASRELRTVQFWLEQNAHAERHHPGAGGAAHDALDAQDHERVQMDDLREAMTLRMRNRPRSGEAPPETATRGRAGKEEGGGRAPPRRLPLQPGRSTRCSGGAHQTVHRAGRRR